VNSNAGLLTALNFTWNGIAYNQTTANTGFIGFDGSGNLTEITFGNHCFPGICLSEGGANEWLVAFPGSVGFLPFEYQYTTDYCEFRGDSNSNSHPSSCSRAIHARAAGRRHYRAHARRCSAATSPQLFPLLTDHLQGAPLLSKHSGRAVSTAGRRETREARLL
jgi:hypothetical protein